MIEADWYKLMKRAVGEGVAYGWNRSHKHTNTPEPVAIKEEIVEAIMNELCEIIIFTDLYDE